MLIRVASCRARIQLKKIAIYSDCNKPTKLLNKIWWLRALEKKHVPTEAEYIYMSVSVAKTRRGILPWCTSWNAELDSPTTSYSHYHRCLPFYTLSYLLKHLSLPYSSLYHNYTLYYTLHYFNKLNRLI